MPGRQYSQQGISGSTSARAKKKKKTAKRALNAFSIAQHTAESDFNPRRSRLGEIENEGAHKRERGDSDQEEDEEDLPGSKRLKHGDKDRFGNEIEGGSDSEGNEWVTGAVGDDDSDLNSDEAMGDGDEEKFESFKFGGSGKKLRKRQDEQINLNEDDDPVDSGEESENFAASAVDLADMLDRSSSEDEEGSDEEEEQLEMSDVDEDANDPAKLSALQKLLSSMDADKNKKRSQVDLAQEAVTPSEYGLNPKQKLSVTDLLSTVTDPMLRKSLKILADDGKKSKSSIPGKLSAPLPKRQQDRIDRAAAFEKSKETLSRWIETIKHNRRAEHLIFPLLDQDIEAAKNSKRILPASKPANELESTIQKILADSGLDSGKQDEELQKLEELATNKMPIEEVRARQAELRRQRDLLFREEIRAKRIKKIKSKSYRRVHRKERERNALREKDALTEAGFVPSEDELEKADRRRAEERMGQRHRESRWAKSIKETGRANWDEDTRHDVTAMLRRDEELKRRMHGQEEDESSESEATDEDEETFTTRMHEKLSKLGPVVEPQSKLSSMKFMQKAEATRKAQNDEAVAQLQRELDGVPEEESDDNGAGRRKFGPKNGITVAINPKEQRAEFEEGHESEQDEVEIVVDAAENTAITNMNGRNDNGTTNTASSAKGSTQKANINPFVEKVETSQENPFTVIKRKKSKKNAREPDITIDAAPKLSEKKIQPISKPAKKAHVLIDGNDSDSSFGGFSPPSSTMDKHALIAQAFAADDVLTTKNFAAEKDALADDEQPTKTTTGGLPGWGSWVGPGLTRREKKDAIAAQSRSRQVIISKDGIAATARKDKNLDKVIISERRVPKTDKYLASSLPFPFESKSQYERSLRLPMGPEFTTKTTFQDMTKPRVLMKGGIVAPMRKPLV